MEEKKADNIILNKIIKQKINNIDEKIELEKKQIKKLDEIQEEMIEFNKDMKKSLELLLKTQRNTKKTDKYNEMYDSNNYFLRSITDSIEETKTYTKKEIYNLHNQKDKILKENNKKG